MRAYIEIDGNALEKNYLDIKKETSKDLIAVIKSNAYGHGLIECAKILYKNKVPFFAVATKEEAILIRKNLIFTPILLLGECLELKTIYSYKITLLVLGLEHLIKLSESPYPISIHLFIDVGMKREGIEINQIQEALSIINKSKLILKGVCTHYSSKENYEVEHSLFLEAIKTIPNINKLLVHSSSSSTYSLNNDDSLHRIGLSLYGLDNMHTPILSLKAPIIRKIKVSKGVFVGYAGKGITPDEGYIYTIGLGYADGWPRNFKTKAYVGDKELFQIGQTCMDYMMFFSKENFEENTIFSIIDEKHPIEDIALEQGTISYEICSKLNQRIKKLLIYKK